MFCGVALRPWVYFAVGGAIFAATIGADALGMGYIAGLPGVGAIFLIAGIVRLSSPDRPGRDRQDPDGNEPAGATDRMTETTIVRRIRRTRLWSRLAFGLAVLVVVALLALPFAGVLIAPFYQAVALTFPLMTGFFLHQRAVSLLDLQWREDHAPE
jgi:hypothetical protein